MRTRQATLNGRPAGTQPLAVIRTKENEANNLHINFDGDGFFL